MYGSMNQISPTEDNDGAAAADSVDNHQHINYDSHALEDGSGGVEDVSTDAVYASGAAGPDLSIDDSSQLTLSFRGEVYVFDSVTPDKVQAVLLLLGGCEISSGSQGVENVSPLNQRGASATEFPVRCNQPHRAASLIRFRQKRKERCFEKKVRYGVRQEVAKRMQRNKGQFTSAKKQDGANNWGSDQESVQDAVQQETSCTHCGISSKSTPMMRRGPSGPRSLCNACGLFWANRGTLRDLSNSKRNQEHSLAPPEQVNEAHDLNHQTATPAHNNPVLNHQTAIPAHNNPVNDSATSVSDR